MTGSVKRIVVAAGNGSGLDLRAILRVMFKPPTFFVLIAFSLVVAASPSRFDQTPSGRSPMQADARTQADRLIAQGKNITPVGALRVRSYRLEELRTPSRRYPCAEAGNCRPVVRLSVTLDTRLNSAYMIWVGDRGYRATVEGEGEVAFGSYNREELKEALARAGIVQGARLAVSHPGYCSGRDTSLTTLPEKISLPRELRSGPLAHGRVKRIYRLHQETSNGQKIDRIAIEFASDISYPARNAMLRLQVGKCVYGDCGEGPSLFTNFPSLTCVLSQGQFARAKSGDELFVGFESPGNYYGRLEKRKLEKDEPK